MRKSVLSFVALVMAWFGLTGIAVAAIPTPPSFASNYQLVWGQDFTTMSSLSVSSQGPCGAGGTTWMAHKPLGGDWFTFIDPAGNNDPFGIGNGYLTIRVQDNGPSNNGFGGYTGGLLSSVDNNGNGFAQQYGYFECSMQLPGGPNTWPAFWLLSLNNVKDHVSNVAELDIMEGTGNGNNGPGNNPPGNPNWDIITWHQWMVNGQPSNSNGISFDCSAAPYNVNLTTGYHTYAVDVEPGGINWYFDRHLVWSTPIYPEAQQPLYVLVNLALGNGNYNNATGTAYDWSLTPNPSDLKVQYIAVWASPFSPNYSGGGVPTAPTNLTATPGNAQVNLSWSVSSTALSYNIYRGTSAGGESPTAIATGLTSTSYNNTGLTNGTTYYYKVVAVNSYGTSGNSNEASATPTQGGTGGATVYYQDGFSRSSELNGSSPDVLNTSGNHWTVSTGTGAYSTNGNAAFDHNTTYDAAYLPVNGSSGVTLDGTMNFTLSATLTPDSTGQWMGISLNTSTLGSGSNIVSNALAELVLGNGYAGAFNGGTSLTYVYSSYTPGTAYPVSMFYNASARTITYVAGGNTLYTLSGVTVAQIAALRVVAFGNGDCGSTATVDNFTLTVGGSGGGGGSAPSAPTSLTATAASTQVVLTWTASTGAISYNVYRGTSTNGESTTAIATGISATSYTDTGLTNGTTYYYKISAVNSYGTSGNSSEVNATPTSGTGGSATTYYQDGFSRSGELNGSAPDVTNTGGNHWTVSSGTGAYSVNGSTVYDHNATYDAAYLPVNGSSGVTLDGTANFTLSATLTPDSTGQSMGISLNTATIPSGGNCFTNGLVELFLANSYAGAFNGGTNLTYAYHTYTAGTAYTISLFYNASAGTITYVAGGNTVYTLSGVTAAQIASLRAVAFGNGDSGSTATVDNFTLSVGTGGGSGGSAPSAPTGLAATAGNTQVVLNWSATSGATSYNVYRGTSSGGESATALVTGITSTSYTNTGLTNGTTYYYKVAAVNSYGTSGNSNEASATPTAGTGGTVYYQDGFSRSGELNGSAPDVTNTGGNHWTVSTGAGAYSTNGSAVYDHNAVYDAAYLPVNGSSGVTLDGTKTFTLSASLAPDSTGQSMGISLNTATIGSGGNIYSNGLAELVLGNGYAGAFNGGTNLTYAYHSYTTGTAYTIVMIYNASTGTITFTAAGTTIYTLSGVTASQISALRAVALGNNTSGSTATVDNFTLTVAP